MSSTAPKRAPSSGEEPSGSGRKKPRIEPALSKLLTSDILKWKRGSRKHSPIISLNHDDTIHDALTTLARHKILSAPVLLNGSVEDNESGHYLGNVDVLGVVHHLRQALEKANPDHDTFGRKWAQLRDAGEHFVNTKLITIAGNDTEYCYQGATDAPLRDLIHTGFTQSSEKGRIHSSHRITVFEGHGVITDIISQSDVIRYCAAHPDILGYKGSMTLDELGLVPKLVSTTVLSVRNTDSTLDAIAIMDDNHVSGVGVVDAEGRLVSCISASDFRGLEASQFPLLTQRVEQYLVLTGHRDSKQANSAVTVTREMTLLQVISELASKRIHRVFVVDKDDKPIVVVSLCDILLALIEE
eukprot:TRINITY_DN359_c0_g1_i1.p1 TRINITY_DN359_c0_g1~~TRINITY_DN359_c0_g1_i1.p1  ORF type:complete len:356 (+),score=41.37 TRINITY_DN359_c0_g1_i1:84-1151(+)